MHGDDENRRRLDDLERRTRQIEEAVGTGTFRETHGSLAKRVSKIEREMGINNSYSSSSLSERVRRLESGRRGP